MNLRARKTVGPSGGVRVVGGDIRNALRTFKQELKDKGVIQDLKDRREFKSKSEIKREQRQRAEYRQKFISENEM